MYRSRVSEGLSQSELEAARLGFNHYLRRKRFSPQFISSHAEELFATATLEYSRKLAEGTEIENPAGFLIACAWRRTKSLLETQSRTPHVIPTDKSEAITDELAPNPEDAALEGDRFRKIQEAVAQLSEEERRLLELSYFEDRPVREAARLLRWDSSKAQRRHEAARRHLQEFLGVESVDDLAIEIGLAAFLSLAAERSSALHLPTGIEGVIETLGRGASLAWARAQELARRLPIGSSAEPSTGAALGSAGRAVGVCATAALACLASGVVGPGVGGVNLLGGDHGKPSVTSRAAIARRPASIPKSRLSPPVAVNPEKKLADPHSSHESSSEASASSQQTRRANHDVASQTIESAASQGVRSAPAEPAPVESSASSSSGSASPSKVASEQFGP